MRRVALGFVVALGCGAAPEGGERLDEAARSRGVAPLHEALTFARRGRELLLVLGVADGKVEAVALPEADDPITLLERTRAD